MNQEKLDKFFKGDCSQDELEQVLAWYTSTKADAELRSQIEASLKENYHGTAWNKAEVLQKVLDRSVAKTNDLQAHSKTIRHSKKLSGKIDVFWLSKIAALFILAFGVAWWLLYENLNGTQPGQNITLEQPAYITKSTDKGQKLTLSLPDGTLVKLNSESKIWFVKSLYEGQERMVHLEGEAFFDVARDTLHPFIIKAGETQIQVLGTSFNVNAYQEQKLVSVAVLTGKVSVDHSKKTSSEKILLSPGEKLISLKNGDIKRSKFDYQAELGWKDGILHFEGATFQEIVDKLERWYGKKIIVQKKWLPRDFTGTYDNKSLKDVLEGISYVMGFKYEINKDIIVIK